MRRSNITLISSIFAWLMFCAIPASAAEPNMLDYTCTPIFQTESVAPNIVFLLDNGAEMEQIVWYSGYVNSTDFTPTPGGFAVDTIDNDGDGVTDEADEDDVVKNKDGTRSGFFNDNGYGFRSHGGKYYLVKVLDTLELDVYGNGLEADSTDATLKKGTWTINSMTVTLPAEPSIVEVDGIIDKAERFRYSKNYLNWMFFASGVDSYQQLSTEGHDGSDLPTKSRFYYSKNAKIDVSLYTNNKANICN